MRPRCSRAGSCVPAIQSPEGAAVAKHEPPVGRSRRPPGPESVAAVISGVVARPCRSRRRGRRRVVRGRAAVVVGRWSLRSCPAWSWPCSVVAVVVGDVVGSCRVSSETGVVVVRSARSTVSPMTPRSGMITWGRASCSPSWPRRRPRSPAGGSRRRPGRRKIGGDACAGLQFRGEVGCPLIIGVCRSREPVVDGATTPRPDRFRGSPPSVPPEPGLPAFDERPAGLDEVGRLRGTRAARRPRLASRPGSVRPSRRAPRPSRPAPRAAGGAAARDTSSSTVAVELAARDDAVHDAEREQLVGGERVRR